VYFFEKYEYLLQGVESFLRS